MSHTPKKVLAHNWTQLRAYLPADLETSAVTCGALQRRRAIDSAALLLRLLLMYAVRLSLRRTVIWALALNLCDISRQDLDTRLQQCGPWLRQVLQQLLATLVPPPAATSRGLGRVHLCDGSSLARAGSPGTEWRLHRGWDPWGQRPLSLELTAVEDGEGCERLDLRPGDLWWAIAATATGAISRGFGRPRLTPFSACPGIPSRL